VKPVSDQEGAIFFTHIPKTGGTTLDRTLFRTGLDREEIRRPRGYRDLLFNQESFRYLPGHHPYGIHRWSSMSDARYYTMLRDPVERAISFYYECLWPRDGKKVADHPEHPTAWRHDLVEFYQIPRFQNVQARMLAGLWADYLGRYVSIDRMGMGAFVVSAAKRHLEEKYEGFGVTERFEKSRQWMASTLGCNVPPIRKKHKTNPERPTAEDLTDSQRDALRRLNRLDVEVYKFACDLFEQRHPASKA
jgi:hypothetical protein